MSDGTITHDAHFQTIDEAKAIFEACSASEITEAMKGFLTKGEVQPILNRAVSGS